MANRAKTQNQMNHNRQKAYLSAGIVMLPKLREERSNKTKKAK